LHTFCRNHEAVITAPDTKYLYFVAKPGFSGYSNFAETIRTPQIRQRIPTVPDNGCSKKPPPAIAASNNRAPATKYMTKLETFIRNSIPFRFLAEKSKRILLPGFRGVPLYDVVKFFVVHIKKKQSYRTGGGHLLQFIMSIPPTCLFLFTLIPQLLPKKQLRSSCTVNKRTSLPADTYNKNLMSFVDSFLGPEPKSALLLSALYCCCFLRPTV